MTKTVKCKRCGNVRTTESELGSVTCTSCQRKINVKLEQIK